MVKKSLVVVIVLMTRLMWGAQPAEFFGDATPEYISAAVVFPAESYDTIYEKSKPGLKAASIQSQDNPRKHFTLLQYNVYVDLKGRINKDDFKVILNGVLKGAVEGALRRHLSRSLVLRSSYIGIVKHFVAVIMETTVSQKEQILAIQKSIDELFRANLKSLIRSGMILRIENLSKEFQPHISIGKITSKDLPVGAGFIPPFALPSFEISAETPISIRSHWVVSKPAAVRALEAPGIPHSTLLSKPAAAAAVGTSRVEPRPVEEAKKLSEAYRVMHVYLGVPELESPVKKEALATVRVSVDLQESKTLLDTLIEENYLRRTFGRMRESQGIAIENYFTPETYRMNLVQFNIDLNESAKFDKEFIIHLLQDALKIATEQALRRYDLAFKLQSFGVFRGHVAAIFGENANFEALAGYIERQFLGSDAVQSLKHVGVINSIRTVSYSPIVEIAKAGVGEEGVGFRLPMTSGSILSCS